MFAFYRVDEGIVRYEQTTAGDAPNDFGCANSHRRFRKRNLNPAGRNAWLMLIGARRKALEQIGQNPHVLWPTGLTRTKSILQEACICGGMEHPGRGPKESGSERVGDSQRSLGVVDQQKSPPLSGTTAGNETSGGREQCSGAEEEGGEDDVEEEPEEVEDEEDDQLSRAVDDFDTAFSPAPPPPLPNVNAMPMATGVNAAMGFDWNEWDSAFGSSLGQ